MDFKYRNPALSGFYPDPSICRVGNDFYLANSASACFSGIPIFHSRDLINWKQTGNAVDRSGQLCFDGHNISQGLFAPTIRENIDPSIFFDDDGKDKNSLKCIKDNMDARTLGTEYAGGFVGTLAGIFATGNGENTGNYADVMFADYRGL